MSIYTEPDVDLTEVKSLPTWEIRGEILEEVTLFRGSDGKFYLVRFNYRSLEVTSPSRRHRCTPMRGNLAIRSAAATFTSENSALRAFKRASNPPVYP